MNQIITLIAFLAIAVNADTWTMTNGVPITGTVVSSQVACVWIKTPLGAVRKIPVEAFNEESCTRLPEDAAGIYVGYDAMRKAVTETTASMKAGNKNNAELAMSVLDASIATDEVTKRIPLLLAEIKAWRKANALTDVTPEQRQSLVDEEKTKAAFEVLKTANP